MAFAAERGAPEPSASGEHTSEGLVMEGQEMIEQLGVLPLLIEYHMVPYQNSH